MVFESESVLRCEERGKGKREGGRRTGEERKKRKPSGAARRREGEGVQRLSVPL